MTPEEATKYLLALNRGGAKFGIERMQAFAKRMGNPERSYPVIHVAGTNGKGSTCALLERVYREAGYRTGMFTSPHLVYIGERLRINGDPVDERRLALLTEQISSFAEEVERSELQEGPTYFEFMTGMAFQYFKEEAVDVAIIEVGLGGRLDSTNIVAPSISVITSISLDHCEQLGGTIESIAREKAGIIKSQIPVVVGELPEAAEHIIRSIAGGLNAPVFSVRERFHGRDEYPVVGFKTAYQRRNAAVAQLVVEVLDEAFPVAQVQCLAGLKAAFWPGRWQEIPLDGGRELVLESAHNEEGAIELRESLRKLVAESEGKKPTMLFGSLGVDRARVLLEVAAPYVSRFILLEPDQPRAVPRNVLRTLVPKSFSGVIEDGEVDRLFGRGVDFLAGVKGDVFLVTGSIYLIGEVLARMQGDGASRGSLLQDRLVVERIKI